MPRKKKFMPGNIRAARRDKKTTEDEREADDAGVPQAAEPVAGPSQVPQLTAGDNQSDDDTAPAPVASTSQSAQHDRKRPLSSDEEMPFHGFEGAGEGR